MYLYITFSVTTQNYSSGQIFQQWSIDDTQAWFYTRSSSKDTGSSGSSGVDCPQISLWARHTPVLQRHISLSSALQPSKDSNDKDLVLPAPPLTKFAYPSINPKINADSLNAERRRKYYQSKVKYFI